MRFGLTVPGTETFGAPAGDCRDWPVSAAGAPIDAAAASACTDILLAAVGSEPIG